MSSAAPPHVLLETRPGPHGRQGLPTLAAEASGHTRPSRPAALSLASPLSAKVPRATEAETPDAYPQVPPESPLPMHARAFDFVGARDLFGLLGQGRRRRSPPALTAAPPSAAPHG